MSFLLGHEAVMEFLERTATQGRPAHAYLFSGREGIGKKTAAVAFACFLNCPEPGHDPDHSCPVCRRINSGNHPDVIVEEPERGMIRIEQIRGLQNFFRFAPVEGRYRVIVINDAHLMNRQAQNALLKTLEEPPPGRILILVSAKPSLLLPTVRSRCRGVRFGPIPASKLAGLLEQKRGLDTDKASTLAAISGGSVAKALEIEKSDYLDLSRQVISILAEPGKSGIKGLLQVSKEISRNRKTAADALDIASGWVRDLLVQRILSDPSQAIHRDFLDMTISRAQHHSTRTLLAVYHELMKATDMVQADTNINCNMVIDVALLKITRLLAGPTLGIAAAD